ncbi:MAG: DJ-1/PfpI family protein [Phormidesmis sp.]
MKIAIATFNGFNEIDSFVALNILNRVQQEGWQAEIVAPEDTVISMNGVGIRSQQPFSFINRADAVLFGSGKLTQDVIEDEQIMSRLKLDPSRQLIGSQCSGALILHHLGLTDKLPVCTDATTAPWLQEAGAQVIQQSFYAKGNIATAGGCLSSQYLAAWIIHRKLGKEAVQKVLSSVAPVGEEENLIKRTMKTIAP